MIEKNVEKHWKEMFQNFYKEEDFVTDKSWPPNCNDANEKSDKAGSEIDTTQTLIMIHQ